MFSLSHSPSLSLSLSLSLSPALSPSHSHSVLGGGKPLLSLMQVGFLHSTNRKIIEVPF